MRPWESLSRAPGRARAAGKVGRRSPAAEGETASGRGGGVGEGSAGKARRWVAGARGQGSCQLAARRVRLRQRELENASNPAGLGFVRSLRPLGLVWPPVRSVFSAAWVRSDFPDAAGAPSPRHDALLGILAHFRRDHRDLERVEVLPRVRAIAALAAPRRREWVMMWRHRMWTRS